MVRGKNLRIFWITTPFNNITKTDCLDLADTSPNIEICAVICSCYNLNLTNSVFIALQGLTFRNEQLRA